MCIGSYEANEIYFGEVGATFSLEKSAHLGVPVLQPTNGQAARDAIECLCVDTGSILELHVGRVLQDTYHVPAVVLAYFIAFDDDNEYPRDEVVFLRNDVDVPDDVQTLTREDFRILRIRLSELHDLMLQSGDEIHGTVLYAAPQMIDPGPFTFADQEDRLLEPGLATSLSKLSTTPPARQAQLTEEDCVPA